MTHQSTRQQTIRTFPHLDLSAKPVPRLLLLDPLAFPHGLRVAEMVMEIVREKLVEESAPTPPEVRQNVATALAPHLGALTLSETDTHAPGTSVLGVNSAFVDEIQAGVARWEFGSGFWPLPLSGWVAQLPTQVEPTTAPLVELALESSLLESVDTEPSPTWEPNHTSRETRRSRIRV